MRKLLIVGVVLLVLVGLGAFAFFNFNTYLQNNREWLAEQATTALGRSVSFDEVGVSFTGGLGARVSNVSIGDDPAFSKEPFLRVDRADVVVKILPALSGRYEVARVVLDAPQVTVIKTAKGFNFDSIGKTGGAAVPASRDSDVSQGSQGGDGALPLLVSVLQIGDGQLRFVDRSSSPSSEIVVEKLDFSASNVGFDDAVVIDFAAAVLGFEEQNLKVDGTVGPLDSPAAAAHAPVDLDMRVGPIIIDRLKKLPVIGDSVPAELSSPDPITVVFAVSGKLDAPAVKASFDATSAALGFGDVFAKPSGTRLALDADVSQSGDVVKVGSMSLRLAEATIRGEGTVGTGSAKPIDFKIRGADVPLDGWGRFFAAAKDIDVGGVLDLDVRAQGSAASGIPALNGTFDLKDVRASQRGGGVEISGLSTRVALDGDRVTVPPTSFMVGGEPVTMSATVTSLKKLAAEFALTSPRLELAALGAGGEGVKKDEVLRDVDVKGSVQSAARGPVLRATVISSGGSLRDVDYTNLAAEVGVADEKVDLKRVTVKAFDGLVAGAGSYDMSKSKPGFTFRGRLSNLDVASIVDFLGMGSTVKMTGAVDGDVSLDGTGSELEQIKQTMTGDGGLQVKRGMLQGVNLADSVLTSVTGVPGLSALIGPKLRAKYPSLFEMSDTAFDTLGSKFNIGGGGVNLEEVTMAAREYRLSGKGSVSFDSVVDIAASFVASPELTQDLLGSLKEAKYLVDAQGRFQIPLHLSGTLPKVRPQPDTQFVAKQLTGALVSKGLDQGLEALFGKKKGGDVASEGGPGERAVDGASEAPAAPAKEAREEPAEKLIRKGLEGLFGGAAQ